MLILTSVFCTSQKISEIAHSHGAIVLVDNSIMSPVLSRPIELGAGIKSFIYLTKKHHLSIPVYSTAICCLMCRYCDALSYQIYSRT
jgi:hypothetical protein